MSGHRGDDRLRVEVELMTDPCLWRWQIRDGAGNTVENSWTAQWKAYESSEEAFREARQRLDILRQR